MFAYIIKRLLLMIPTLLGIMLMSFAIIQFAPGGPVEQVIARLQGTDVGRHRPHRRQQRHRGRRRHAGRCPGRPASNVKYRGAQGLDPEFIKSLEKQFGFDKPAPERFLLMIKNYATFNFGESYFRDVR